MNILIVEDEAELARNVMSFLGTEEFHCIWCTGVQVCRKMLLSEEVDIVLLDLSLPDGLGFELLSYIKMHFQQVQIIIISANHSVDYKLLGLNSGADDYMTKPFSLSELKARIMAVSRRATVSKQDRILEFNEIRVDLESHEFTVNNQAVELTKKEVNLLVYLINNKRRVLSRQALATHLWGDYTYNLENVDFVYQQVKNLRKKIKDAGGADYLKTIYGIGYKWTD